MFQESKALTPRHNDASSRSRGVTLVEVLVVLSIIALAASLLIPAIQSARRAAWRATCSNNLRQIGIALHAYTETHNCLPKGYNGEGYSLFAMLLPNLEQGAIYNSINFSRQAPFIGIKKSANFTAAFSELSVLLCPADASNHQRSSNHTNYAGNGGYDRLVPNAKGLFSESTPDLLTSVGMQSILDGTTQTAAVGEWVVGGPRRLERNPLATVYNLPLISGSSIFNTFANQCTDLDEKITAQVSARHCRWICGGFGDTLYNHILLPNQHTCLNGGHVNSGIFPSSSFHNGGINVLFADGHVDLKKSSISASVWRALGTRSGQEILSDPAD